MFDEEIYNETIRILKETNEYEMIYYIFHSMSEDPKKIFYDEFIRCLDDEDPLIRKMALRGLSEIGKRDCIDILENMLIKENNPSVIGEITRAICKIKNEQMRLNKKLITKYIVNENGLIGDDSDKWYADANIYNIFSEAEDVENICFNLICQKLKEDNIIIRNPVDLATGTGRTFKNILNNISYQGTLYAVDLSSDMLKFLQRTIDRQKYYVNNIKLVESSIEKFKLENNEKSTFIISSFGFPSKITNEDRCLKELKAVYDNLDENGVFVTIGWDETFNDELNEMWYRYIPDNIIADSFYDWQRKRAQSIKSPRNCNLSWYKTNLQIPLQFSSLEESINVMGHLFGRDAAVDILKNRQVEWWMSMGITYDTKQSLKNALKKMGVKL